MTIIHEVRQAPRVRYIASGHQVMAKPLGPVCNLRCEYCYYLEKEALYPEVKDYRMTDEVLESFVRQYIRAQPIPEVPFVWQGGEPTLLGLDFFRRALDLQKKYGGEKWITNALQTNGTLLTDEWCEFLAGHNFLVGLSLDGPEDLHDRHRLDRGGAPTFRSVMRGLDLLKKHSVEFNVLAVVAREHSRRALDVYRFLRGAGMQFIQFIPIVERVPCPESRRLGIRLGVPPSLREREEDTAVTPWSVEPEGYGQFLIDIFEEWVRNDVGSVFVMNFEWALSSWMNLPPHACFFMPQCGKCAVIEHNGDVYSCDHYVYPGYLIGNILRDDLGKMFSSPGQVAFGEAKENALPKLCRECPVLAACRGECCKHRFMTTPDGEPGLNYLCAGYKKYFTHISPYLKWISQLMRSGQEASKIMELIPR